MQLVRTLLPVALSFVAAGELHAQQPRDRNLETCLAGKYPSLCDYGRLTTDQLREARAAELRENLRMCLTGKYPALCNHSKLAPEQATQVREAERAENLRVCSSGKYPALCRHDLLTDNELTQVHAAERAENLRVCMDGRYPALCNHPLLTADQAKEVAAAEAKVASSRPRTTSQAAPRKPSVGGRGTVAPVVPGGHIIEASVSDETFVINGEVFKAKTYCFGFERGDRVEFLSGSAFGACASPAIVNMRSGKTCELWCE